MAGRYYIAADGGGTKLLAVLYDEEWNVIRTAKSGGTNLLFRPKEVAAAEVEALAEELIPQDVSAVEAVDLSFVGSSEPFLEAVRRRCPVKTVRHYGEGHVALASAGVRWGVVAQAGTGSDAFLIQPDGAKSVGGWGVLLGDEGGGYDIGARTLRAAIYAEDGRGPRSVLPELIKEAWGIPDLWGMIGKISGNPDSRSLVASVSYLTEKAALLGDEAALAVYEAAGHEMSLQVLTVIRNAGGRFIGPVIASGGAWKGCFRMFETFRDDVKAVHPGAEIRFPEFEPLVGSVVGRLLAENGGAGEYAPIPDALREKFAAFRYRRPADCKEELL